MFQGSQSEINLLPYGDMLAVLKKLDTWLTTLGLDAKHDRAHHAVDTVQCFSNAHAAGLSPPHLTEPGVLFGLQEAFEFYDIIRVFEQDDPVLLKAKISRILSGPFHPILENERNSDARNVAFELILAAEWRLLGLDVRLGEPDLIVTVDGVDYIVECKRPYQAESIRANVRGAARQLSQELDRPGREAAMGIIAISITRIINPGKMALWIENPITMNEELGRYVEQTVQDHKQHWLSHEMHPRIAAVALHASVPAFGMLHSVNVTGRARHIRIHPSVKRCSPAFHTFADRVGPLYDRQ
jgi:hypothetical protein